MKENQKAEIQEVYELLIACLEEEGYEIPFAKYADKDYKAFDLPLRSGEKVLVTLSWV
ncbi:hypothetical protein RE628_11360 [Paenibacillus sp. D2_2]|uniref:hypothetical protein n=1 Tax=Paenibacillus sp. D2_2 TaxID=3073092 RepID=UPI002816667C|nr:hypothetical protein [Paenibacillus sp. D2_2]WMT42825.1 hypothetical protein RE628_11360 [Paenibacillus sp. D2_2]